jgi:hypothetical protein
MLQGKSVKSDLQLLSKVAEPEENIAVDACIQECVDGTHDALCYTIYNGLYGALIPHGDPSCKH